MYKVSKGGFDYAMKLERMDQRKQDQLLPLEAHILKRLQFTPYAARFVEFGKCNGK